MTAADRLAEIEARFEAATDGPWEFQPRRGFQSLSDNPGTIGFTDSAGYFVMMREGTWATEADMTLVAHARTDLPATVKALRAVLELHFSRTDIDDFADRLPWCNECSGDYPCATVVTITEALGGAS